MRILSKYKDYYDYLVGKWGMDEKLILDRTEFEIPYISDGAIHLYICGMRLDGYKKDDKFYYLEELEQFDVRNEKKYNRYYWLNKNPDDDYVVIHDGKSTGRLNKVIKIDENCYNEKLNCPILIRSVFGKAKIEGQGSFSKFPILKELRVQSAIKPEDMWFMLSSWLSRNKDIPNTQTDKEKIIGHGFDYKLSFRKGKDDK